MAKNNKNNKNLKNSKAAIIAPSIPSPEIEKDKAPETPETDIDTTVATDATVDSIETVEGVEVKEYLLLYKGNRYNGSNGFGKFFTASNDKSYVVTEEVKNGLLLSWPEDWEIVEERVYVNQ